MIKIGKIVFDEKLHDHKELPYIVYQDLNVLKKDETRVPTLIVGWKLANKLFPSQNLDILEREIKLNKKHKYYWEFTPMEDIVQYTQGLELFVKRLPHHFIKGFEYQNVDPFFHNMFTLDQIDKHFSTGGYLYVYKNDMAYYRLGDIIQGMKLSVYEYIGIDIPSIISLLVSKSEKHALDDGTEYQKYYKMFPEFGLLKRSMVVFVFP